MHTPPLPGSRVSTSSGTLRGWPQSARADEWLKITGAVLTSRASCIVVSATCDRSTSMPIRFISAITSRPKSFRPPSRGTSVALSAQATFWLWVRVRYRTPSRASMRRTASESQMLWPPSAPISPAMRPARKAASTWSAVRAGASRPECSRVISWTRSICWRVRTTAAAGGRSPGT
ncbi:hypothetical protein Aca07nite_17250 [Actinoplanes capillaceus]|uniref:Uncharacterized protein n=1 Tax=Actinoplanes campanulatus TaxID=113559 RepID=A0ABQ3WFE0_9ACTN|nr:hypothetical protein Aca07nite_17250 [Actinoplanes capillaceus]